MDAVAKKCRRGNWDLPTASKLEDGTHPVESEALFLVARTKCARGDEWPFDLRLGWHHLGTLGPCQRHSAPQSFPTPRPLSGPVGPFDVVARDPHAPTWDVDGPLNFVPRTVAL